MTGGGGGREGGREGGRQGGRERGREGGREAGREGEREGGREGVKKRDDGREGEYMEYCRGPICGCGQDVNISPQDPVVS